MTKYLKIFCGVAFFLSLAFFYFLNEAILTAAWGQIVLLAVGFGLSMFLSGWLLGGKDEVRLTRVDLGFRYHLATYIIVNLVGLVIFAWFMGFTWWLIISIGGQILPWTLGLLVHYWWSLRSIKGMDKADLFD